MVVVVVVVVDDVVDLVVDEVVVAVQVGVTVVDFVTGDPVAVTYFQIATTLVDSFLKMIRSRGTGVQDLPCLF